MPVYFAYANSTVLPPDSVETGLMPKDTAAVTLPFNRQGLPVRLQNPSNVVTEVRYDYRSNLYIFEYKVGDAVINTPVTMTPKEYMEYRSRQMQSNYFRKKNSLNRDGLRPSSRYSSLSGIRKRTNQPGTIFGPGGIRFTAQGSVEISAGIKRDFTGNPGIPQRSRVRNIFDSDQQIKLNMNAKVGEKINFDINYNTDATFDADAKQIRLAYKGDEDEIIKNIEAGNVNMSTTNSLIDGGAALLGIKSELQFGKLRVNTVISQQQSESQTVNTGGGVQTTQFELNADKYDENRHFFLGHYFRDTYDNALAKLPYVQSSVSITRMEVWVTNKRGEYDRVRNIIAFADLGEHNNIHNPMWTAQGSSDVPDNMSNTMYGELVSNYPGARNLSETENTLPGSIVPGTDYEKLENARLLSPSEYKYRPQLGYISLNMPLQPDEVLAIAYEYTYNGRVYQVGEFSGEVGSVSAGNGDRQKGALFVKLLKPVSFSPRSPAWGLMMKNIYSIGYGAYNVQKDRFRMNVTYQSDSSGIYMNYLPGSGVDDKLLLTIMNLDRLDSRNNPNPDGIFDFLEGYTIDSENGWIIFPVTEPFGSHLKKKIDNDAIARKYVYQELYDSTLTAARQVPERNKFRLSGEYRGSSAHEINLNAVNVERGSVRVTAGGIPLTEGVDYTVDYLSGIVSIINRSVLESGTPVSVTLENRLMSHLQRKTLMGINLLYDFSKDFSAGVTLMHYYEKPLIMKSAYGDESAKNTLWGANLSYRRKSYALTNLIDMLPFVDATAPSQLSANLEFAHLIAGHYKNRYTGEYSYIDDFESSSTSIDLRTPYSWSLASTPLNNTSSGLFPEAALSNNTDYGKNRALMAWFYIDGIFTGRNSSLTPAHIKNDHTQLSDHRVREIFEREIYPNRDAYYGQPATIPALNISYYPNERGPYNLDSNVDGKGNLLNPEQRWGGITRRMDTRDFEAANIEYIEFWLMDPFVNDTLGTSTGGDLYFNLGDISEDVLKDGKKFFENGLPVDGDTTAVGYTVWGKYPKRQSTVYAFDNSQGMEARRLQDVGLNGLSSEEEKVYPSYANYLNELRPRLSGETISAMEADSHSPLNDPAGDKFRHYRGAEQDRMQMSILERYKYFNGTEGNSLASDEDARYSSISRSTPDVEDIDNDNTLNENESYYQYRVSLRHENMETGSNFIVDRREVSVRLRNGQDGKVNWYQFKIPVRDYQQKIGNINGFNNIRFMRIFLTGFEEPVFLRFATLELVRSEWRSYTKDPVTGGEVTGTGSLDISTVNIEENGNRTPVNYVLPPGVTRILDPGQPQLRQENEQSLSIKVQDLEPGASRSIYKNSMYDMRRYKRLQMFVHAEQLPEVPGTLQDGDLSIFLRLGSDYRDNFYEYEIPLRITPEGQYSTNSPTGQKTVWPLENMFDFPLELFTGLKLERNAEKHRSGGADYYIPYSLYDPDKPGNRITIIGNPSLAEVKVMMIGIRNHSDRNQSGEVWINELRLSEFDEKGGWAFQGNMQLALSDIGTVAFSGRKETAGFGALSRSLLQRRNDDYLSMHMSFNLELGRFLPRQAKVTAPFQYSYSDRTWTPLYDPFNRDILLSESLKQSKNRHHRDSIQNISTTSSINKSISLSNVKVNISSKNPMPYDPANLSFTFARNINELHSPDTEYATVLDYRIQADYEYSPLMKSLEPFKNIKDNSGWLKPVKALYFNLLPNNIRAGSLLVRNYQEKQLRSLNAQGDGTTQSQRQYLSFSRNFFWDRDFSITWDLTRNLKASFHSGTIAEIEEPYLQVNKKINRSDYEIWKDSVIHSIRELGKPLNYEQAANVTYILPFAHIAPLDWISSSAAYNSRYRWERGAVVDDENTGNFLQNDFALSVNSRFNLVLLYNKIPFLQKANSIFNGGAGPMQADISPAEGSTPGYDIASYAMRAVMMVRSINLNFGYMTRTSLPGYDKMIGDIFGQHNGADGLLPGLGFAFGFDGGKRFIERMKEDNLLVINKNNITPAISNRTKNMRLEVSLEPFPGLKIDLNALYEDNRRTEFQFMFEEMPVVHGGSFAMTTISLSSAFENQRAGKNYFSSTFERFRKNREAIASRVRGQYELSHYPSSGFLAGSSYAGQPFDPATGDVNINSAEVLIPSLLAAYTGKSPNSVELTAFPNMRSLLPNWNISFDMMSILPELGEHVKSLNLVHQYISHYRVGSFSSYLSWVPANDDGDLGYIRDALSGSPIPSTPYDISAVTITESFHPLIEANSILSNNMNVSLRINRTRALNLNIPSYRIVEMNDNDIVVGIGYRIADFNRIAGFGSNSMQRVRNSRLPGIAGEKGQSHASETFSNTLNLRFDVSHKTTSALIRKIEDGFTQATSGIKTITIRFTADYELSRALTLRAFYDKLINTPLVSSSSYPGATTNAGVSLRINLIQ